MKPWEIWSWKPAGWAEAHPVVIVSHPDRVARKDPVDLLVCSTQRSRRPPEAHELLLDEADGLNGPTLCRCDVIYAANKDELSNRRGMVQPPRRAALIRTILVAHGWTAEL